MDKKFTFEECLQFLQHAKSVSIGAVYGDVIESGGVKHVTYNNHYYGEVPQATIPMA